MAAYDTLTDLDNQTLTLSIMRKYYKGKKIVPDRFNESLAQLFHRRDKPYNIECFFNASLCELELSYSYMDSWSGDVINYYATIVLNEDQTIKTMSALHGMKLCYSDARSDEYKNIRAGSSDYIILDTLLDFVCSPSVQFVVSDNVLYSYSSTEEYTPMEKYIRNGGQIYDCVIYYGILYVPEGVVTCDFCAFDECKDVQIIYLPTSVKHVRHGAFLACTSLEKICIPESVKKIGVHDENYINDNVLMGSRGNICEFINNHTDITVVCPAGSVAGKYCKLFGIKTSTVESERFEYSDFRKATYRIIGEF